MITTGTVHLVFVSDAEAYGNSYYGNGTGPIVYTSVSCEGTEASIANCPFKIQTATCDHSEDVGVRCPTSKSTCNSTITLALLRHCSRSM